MGRAPDGPEPDRSRYQPSDEGADVSLDSERGHALLSAAIGRGLIEGDPDRRGREKTPRPVTRGQILAAAIGSVSIVLIGIGLLPFLYAMLVPTPFYYENLPFHVCGPGTTS